MSFQRQNAELQKVCGIFKNVTYDRSTPYQLVLSRKWRRQIENQQKATMFLEHMYIIGMVDLSTVARIIYLVGGRSISEK